MVFNSSYAVGEVMLEPYEKHVLQFYGLGTGLFSSTNNSDTLVAWIKVDADYPIGGFELFGVGQNVELSGIQAGPVETRDEPLYMPIGLEAGEADSPSSGLIYHEWNGFVLLNPTDMVQNTQLRILDHDGVDLVNPVQISLKAGSKTLGLLDANGLVYPYPASSPILALPPADKEKVATLLLDTPGSTIAFTLGGNHGSRFDGLGPAEFHEMLGVVPPDNYGDLYLKVLSRQDDVLAIRLFDSNGNRLKEYGNLAMVANSSFLWWLNKPGRYEGAAQIAYIQIVGQQGGETSQLAGYLLDQKTYDDPNDGTSLAIYPAFEDLAGTSYASFDGNLVESMIIAGDPFVAQVTCAECDQVQVSLNGYVVTFDYDAETQQALQVPTLVDGAYRVADGNTYQVTLTGIRQGAAIENATEIAELEVDVRKHFSTELVAQLGIAPGMTRQDLDTDYRFVEINGAQEGISLEGLEQLHGLWTLTLNEVYLKPGSVNRDVDLTNASQFSMLTFINSNTVQASGVSRVRIPAYFELSDLILKGVAGLTEVEVLPSGATGVNNQLNLLVENCQDLEKMDLFELQTVELSGSIVNANLKCLALPKRTGASQFLLDILNNPLFVELTNMGCSSNTHGSIWDQAGSGEVYNINTLDSAGCSQIMDSHFEGVTFLSYCKGKE